MTRHEITLKRVLYEIPGMRDVTVRRDIEYGRSDAGPLTMDVYVPSGATTDTPSPVVILAGGFPDVGVTLTLGCTAKEMEMTISWAQLIAASGMAAIAYTKRDPASDARALVAYVREHAAALGLDRDRVGVFAASGSAPVALSLLAGAERAVTCGVLLYGYTLDLDGATGVAESAKQWGFVNAAAGTSLDDFPADAPLFIVRAGREQFPHLNAALDRFVAGAVARNRPITFVNHHDGPHAFDLFDDREISRAIVRQALAFLRERLRTISLS
jgi:hypothetical protein